ncbi:hypothetical protein ACFX2I_022904 [Malus domestica]
MAESVVTFLLDRLTSLIEQEGRLFSGVQAQIEDIIDELERIKAFLRVADTEEDEDPRLKVWVKQVRDLAYEIEDALDKFRLSHSHVHRHGFHAIPSSVAGDIQGIKSKIRSLSEGRDMTNTSLMLTLAQARLGSFRSVKVMPFWLEEADLVAIGEPKR